MNRRTSRLGFLAQLEGLPIAMVLVVLYVVFMFTAPSVFTGYRIYMSFFQTVPPMLVLAIGLTFIITAGEIDLSFPAVVALSGFVFTGFSNTSTRRGSASSWPSLPGPWSATSTASWWPG
jgi:simple sugar transport system permease protein